MVGERVEARAWSACCAAFRQLRGLSKMRRSDGAARLLTVVGSWSCPWLGLPGLSGLDIRVCREG